MLLLIHILIAVSSLVSAGWAFIKPSPQRLNSSYTLIGLTVATGTVLTIQMSSRLMHACIAGLIYLSVAFMATIAARKKMRLAQG